MKIVSLFGSKILENPETIDADDFIDTNSANAKTEHLIVEKMFQQFSLGQNFTHCADDPEIQNFLRIIYENQHSQKKFNAALSMGEQNLSIVFKDALMNKKKYENVKAKLEEFMKPSNEIIIDENPYEQNNFDSLSNKPKRSLSPKPTMKR